MSNPKQQWPQQGHQAFSWHPLGCSAQKSIFVASSCSVKSKAAMAPARSPSLLLASPRLLSAKKASLWPLVAVSNPKQQWPQQGHQAFSWHPLGCSAQKSIFVASSCSVKSKAAMAPARSPSLLLASPRLLSAKKHLCGFHLQCQIQSSNGPSKVTKPSLGIPSAAQREKASLWPLVAVSNPKQQWPQQGHQAFSWHPIGCSAQKSIFVASSCSVKSKAAMAPARSPSLLLASPRLLSAKKHLCGL